jgi:hypothetical protein
MRPIRRSAIVGVGGFVALGTIGLVALGGATTLTGSTAAGPAAPPRFEETAGVAGVAHRYDGEFEFYVGGGVAVFDCSDDGRPDLYIAGGSQRAGLFRNESPVGGPLRFARVTDPATDLAGVTGAYPLDIDGDGVTDIAVLRNGENVLLRGLGACGFARANEGWSFDGGEAWTTAFSAKWEGDRLPTLAFGNYRNEASDDPDRLCFPNVLVRPSASGGGYGTPTTLSPSWCALSMLFTDWDRSGRIDLRVSNDRHYYSDLTGGQEQLWRVGTGGSARLYTADDGWKPLRLWGMGIASQDITGDGYPEVYLTSIADSHLQTLADGPTTPTYRDIGLERGVTATHPFSGPDTKLPSTAWHPEFADVNNDGLVDLFVSKGNVEAIPDNAAMDPSNLFLAQHDGTFSEAADAAGIVDYAKARGAALVDLDLDGSLDLVQVVRRDNVRLWHNVGSSGSGPGHWVAIRLAQPGSNRNAIGAWLELKAGDRTMTREMTVGGGHGGGQLGWIHFGLGPTDRAEVRVRWPGDELGPWLPIEADAFYDVERGATAARQWRPPGP